MDEASGSRGNYAPVQPLQVYVVVLSLFLASTPVKGGQEAMYPYGPITDDQSANIGLQATPIPLPVPMKFYGQSFKTAYILKDGIVALEPGVRYLEVEWKEGTPNHGIDLPFIAPFHYNGFLPINNPQAYPGKIYYKLMSRARNDVSISEADRQFMLKLDDYLAGASVVLKSGFTSDFVLKVTWENVSSISDCSEDQLISSRCPSNTFQVVIAANTEHTFAIFNYYKMEIPFTVHQLAGINGGHERGWTDVIPCTGACAKRSKGDKSRIMSLASRVGSDVAGRYILVVGDDIIVRGGCLADGLKYSGLEVYPRQSGMFGGEMLSVSGTCSAPGTTIYCRFARNNQMRSEGVMETAMRGRCPVPLLMSRGEVVMEMSTDNMSWDTKTTITIIHPGRLPPPVDLSGIWADWNKIDPAELRVRWTRDLFSSNIAATLDLNLLGYREDRYSDNPLIISPLEQLGTGLMNNDEEHTVDPGQFACSGSECDFEIALVQVRVADQYIDQTTKYQFITFGPVPLGWYVKGAMQQQYGSDWPVDKCHEWNRQDKLSSEWLQHLLPCPCTLSQALADWGRWQPDMGCNMFTGSVCTYHIGAKHCVRSVHPSPDHSGNQCCYEDDGNLRYAADTFQGSTPDRSHDWGSAPFAAPDQVPSLSHWLHDVVTFYYCCLWVEYGECSYYMDRRATRDCKAYRPSHSATVYGDPHITTFDGASYYFGGAGDFWLLKSDSLKIQGRFEQRENQYLQIGPKQLAPTTLTSLVMWTSRSDTITINIAPPGSPQNRKLDVRVGKQRRFFEESSLIWQDFNNVSVVNNAGSARYDDDKHHSNFTVLFVGGAAVQVAERLGLLHVIVSLPPNSGQTEGLLGTLDGDKTNDFKNPQGQVLRPNANEDTIYLDFAVRWGVPKDDSRFHFSKDADTTNSPLYGDAQSFAYKAGSENMRPSDGDVQRVCGESQSCRRDFYVSSDPSVARATRKTEEGFEGLRSSQKIVRTCGLLDIPMALKSSTVYTEGAVVRVTGCRPNGSPVQGSGPLVYTCSGNGTDVISDPVWSPQPVHDLCPHGHEEETAEEASDVGLIVGIVVAVVVVIVIAVIIIVVILHGRRGRGEPSVEESEDRPVPTRRSKVPEDSRNEPGTDQALLRRDGREKGGVKMSEVITEMKGRGKSEEV